MTSPEDSATRAMPTRRSHTDPPPGSVDALDVGSTLGRFRLDALLGEGGMGRVFDAWDPRLRRRVAIKTLRIRNPESLHRFVREARLQGSVSHPGICPVFEVGDDQTAPYIVMQRLHGRPLDQAAEGLLLEQKLVLVRRVAEAVHEAHRTGLIHRDLKPSNILVETADDDPLRPVVVDFGIARVDGDAELTRTGDMIGTPAYMAPEQVRGELDRLDRRTDVYALGATLYRLLVGKPPFADTGVEALVQVLHSEPPSLRSHQVPKDVEAIVFKCLEKDPERRYQSARDLALDIDRYLDGEEVSARPIGPWYRLQKRLQRQRVALRVGIVSAVLLVLALGWGAWIAQQAEKRERLARELTEQVEEIEAQVRYSHLSPLHDIRPDLKLLRARMAGIEQAMSRAGRIGHGPGHFALGRGYFALGELEKAKVHLRTAWDSGFQDAQVGAALAQALSALYRERLAGIELSGDWQARGLQIESLQETYGHPARAVLAALPSADDAERRPEASPEGVLLHALALFHDDRFADALEVLADSSARHPWSYELIRLEGDIQRTWAIRQEVDGETAAARAALKKARQAYLAAAEIAESDPSIYRAEALTAFQQISFDIHTGQSSGEALSYGLERLDLALTALPDDGDLWLWKARLHRLGAQELRQGALAPTEHLQAAIDATQRALQDPETSSKARLELGRTHWSRGQWLIEQGEDPVPELDRATQAFKQVAPPEQTYAYWIALGMTHATRGEHLLQRGEPALETFDLAADAYRKATRRHSAPVAAWTNLGVGLFKASSAPGTQDPVLWLHKAVEALEQAEQLRADYVAPPYYLGLCRLHLAQGGDPASGRLDLNLIERAVESFQRAQRIAPDMFQIELALGETAHLRAIHQWERGHDPSQLFAEAKSHYSAARTSAPDSPILRLNSAWTAYFQAKVLLASGQDPTDRLDEASRLYGGLDKTFRTPAAQSCLGSLFRLRGEWALRRQLDPEPYFSQAQQIFELLLQNNPRSAEAHRSLGRIWTRRAERLAAASRDPEAAFLHARNALDQALDLGPSNAYYLVADARRHKAHAMWLNHQNRPDDAITAIELGLNAVRRAREIRPEWRRAQELESLFLTLSGVVP